MCKHTQEKPDQPTADIHMLIFMLTGFWIQALLEAYYNQHTHMYTHTHTHTHTHKQMVVNSLILSIRYYSIH